tara:strand:+ start:974 stop:1408 length:435 start_codon:yes stop_codon:yes gene_type:complete
MKYLFYTWNSLLSNLISLYYNIKKFKFEQKFIIDNKTITIKINHNINQNDIELYFNRYFDTRDIEKYSFEKIFNLQNTITNIDNNNDYKGLYYYITFYPNVHKRTKIFIDKINNYKSLHYYDVFFNETIIKNVNCNNNRIMNIV